MAWTAPRTWVSGEIVTASLGNTHWRDNLRYLKGLDGVPTIESGLIIDNTDGDEYLQIPSLTTTERNALTPVAGMLIYNETTTQFNKYENGAWRSDLGFNSHHGDLSGLTDDDHTIYIKHSLADAANDFLVASGADTFVKKTLAETRTIIGAALISSGQYTGNDGVNRAVAHGLGVAPKLVFITKNAAGGYPILYTIMIGAAHIKAIGDSPTPLAVTAPDATNFYVGNATSYANSANANTIVYDWVAIG